MRQSEIASIVWPDVDDRVRIVVVRDRKNPKRKDGNHQRVPLIALTGYDLGHPPGKAPGHQQSCGGVDTFGPVLPCSKSGTVIGSRH